jgi:hypothetical protein
MKKVHDGQTVLSVADLADLAAHPKPSLTVGLLA